MTRLPGGRWLAIAAALASLGVLQLSLASPVSAQGPVYTATPPTLGALHRDGQSGRYLLGGTWLYRADLSNVGTAGGWWRNVAATDGWTPVTVPNAYNAGDLSTLSNSGYVGWYRRDFTLPAHAFASYVPASARQWILRFESVNYSMSVWLNGKRVGSHTGAYLPFEFDLHPSPGVNRLIVRVDDRRSAADLPPVGNTWWNYGGLLREVYLRTAQRADIQLAQVRPILPCPTCAARIQEQATIRNVTGASQRVTLRGRFGKLPLSFGSATIRPHGTWTPRASALVRHPSLWAPGHPDLYKATLTLSDARGRTLGAYTTYTGIRSIKVNAHGHLTINGRLLDLRGTFIHEQNYLTGAALSPAQLGSLMRSERELGADVIRSHYPLNPEILEMADRLGILVWDEIPAWQVGNKYLGSSSWLAFAHSFLRQNILDNQNHPSVMLWSIGNELPTPARANEASYIAGAAALARRLDPTRPVGMATSGWPGVACQSAYAPLDVIGNNEYFGWFDAGAGATDDRDGLSPYLDSLRACYPKKALFVTEFGFDANRHGSVEERGTYEFQSNSVAFHLGVFASKPWLSGAIYFALQDFTSKPGWGGGNPLPNPPWIYKGLVDQYGALKPAFSVVSSIYHHTVQVGPAPRGR